MLSMSQTKRIGASRLFEFSEILDVPVSYFFEDMPDELLALSGSRPKRMPSHEPEILDPLLEPDSVALVRAYGRIESATIRKSLFNLAKTLGRTDGGDNKRD